MEKSKLKAVKGKSNVQKSLLLYADFGCTTGFANVAKSLVDEWKKDKNLSIVIFAINDKSPKIYDYAPNVKVIPSLIIGNGSTDVYRRIELLNLIYQNDFDVIFMLNDVEVINAMHPNLKEVKNKKREENRPNFKSIIYFPIDSEPRMADLKVLDFFDEVITYTEYAKSVMKPLLSDTQFKKIKVIPHGTNTDDFYPYKQKAKLDAKVEIFGSEDVFVFGSVNRNQVRKDMGALIIGFAMFKHTSQANAVLYLHCNPIDPMGINIPRLCDRVGLEIGKDVIIPKDFSENNGTSIEELNKIYNSFDCFITTTTSEGWGLTITEAMATKTLVVCPKHTSITEITNNGENSLNFMFSQQAVFVNDFEKIRFVTNPMEVKTILEVVLNLKNEEPDVQLIVKKKIEDAYEKVSAMKWDGIAKRFKTIIDKLAK
jgi:glycosyltransferase involved in cell wall biosynthesis